MLAATRSVSFIGRRAVPVRAMAIGVATTKTGKPPTKTEDYLHSMPTHLEIAQGYDKEEQAFMAANNGAPRWERGPMKAKFGTFESPVIIASPKPLRIVGCVGDGGEREHDLLWFRLTPNRKHICVVCGQFFKLHVDPECAN